MGRYRSTTGPAGWRTPPVPLSRVTWIWYGLFVDGIFKLAIITGRQSSIVANRAEQLGFDFVYQGSDNKLVAYTDLLSKSGVEEDQVCYAGDDWIDLPVLLRVGLAVTVPGADDEVKDRVHWVTSREGGSGAVRELCNLILKAQELDQKLLEEFLS